MFFKKSYKKHAFRQNVDILENMSKKPFLNRSQKKVDKKWRFQSDLKKYIFGDINKKKFFFNLE